MIRNAHQDDLEQVVAIYNASVPGRMATADTEPVAVDSRRAWFFEREARHPLWVSERAGQVVGWLSFGKFYGRPAYAATAELGVYVDPRAQRQGVARELLAEATRRAPSLGLQNLLGFVFAHNTPSLALCRGFRFVDWGRLPGVAILDGVERDLLILGLRIAQGS